MHKSLVRTETMRTALRIALLGALWVASVGAQVDTGSIVGTVRDPSGAAVPAAKVVIANTATTVPETVTTDSNGQYVAPLLKVGVYSVSVEKAGFGKYARSGINVDVQARLQVDVTLQLG